MTILSAVVILIGCRTGRPTIGIGGYSFEFEGESYRIESITPSFQDGHNILIRKVGNQLVLKAIDIQQNGHLDEVEVGNISIERARKIYRHGIDEGEKRGYVRIKTFAREYRTRIDHNQYIMATFIVEVGRIYNKLVVRDLSRREAVIIDKEADGQLDLIEKGDRDLGYYQKHYRMVLIRGLEERRLVRENGRYKVVY
jgi:hypothetical protein